MTVSFHSRSLQYKKLSCLQRGGQSSALCWHGYIAVLYHSHHHQGAWFQVKEKSLLLASTQVVRICPVDSILSQQCHSLPVLMYRKEALLWEAPHGTKRWRWAWAQLSPTWAEGSQPKLKGANLSWREPTWAKGSQAEPGWAKLSQVESGKAVKSSHANARNSCVKSSPAS